NFSNCSGGVGPGYWQSLRPREPWSSFVAEKPTFAVHSYPWYISDWISSETRIDFNMEQRGLYRELLDYCYREGSLPADPRKLAIIAGCSTGEFDRAWPVVEKKFTRAGDRFIHRKVDEVLFSLEAWRD